MVAKDKLVTVWQRLKDRPGQQFCRETTGAVVVSQQITLIKGAFSSNSGAKTLTQCYVDFASNIWMLLRPLGNMKVGTRKRRTDWISIVFCLRSRGPRNMDRNFIKRYVFSSYCLVLARVKVTELFVSSIPSCERKHQNTNHHWFQPWKYGY